MHAISRAVERGGFFVRIAFELSALIFFWVLYLIGAAIATVCAHIFPTLSTTLTPFLVHLDRPLLLLAIRTVQASHRHGRILMDRMDHDHGAHGHYVRVRLHAGRVDEAFARTVAGLL